MENASKALLMAGGILIALLVIGALLLMFNQISTYQQSETSNDKNTQLAKFNMDFERYLDNNGISGADVVALANKIVDYNNKEGTYNEASNSVDYNLKITLTVNMDGFSAKYAYENQSNHLFSKQEYKITSSNDSTKNKKVSNLQYIIDSYNGTSNDLLKLLSTCYSSSYSKSVNITKMKEAIANSSKYANDYENWPSTPTDPTYDAIINYKEYTEFKTSTFERNQETEYYDNGQIKNIFLKWKN